MTPETISDLVKFGPGYVLAIIMFVVWLQTKKENEKKWEERDKKMVGVFTERKTDRDKLYELMGRIEGHFARSDAFENFARELIDNASAPAVPKRRIMDRKLANALAQVTGGKDAE